MNQFAFDATGYRFNCITPFLMKANFKILFPEALTKLHPKYFWVGGGEIELKVGISIEDFKRLYGEQLLIFDFTS